MRDFKIKNVFNQSDRNKISDSKCIVKPIKEDNFGTAANDVADPQIKKIHNLFFKKLLNREASRINSARNDSASPSRSVPTNNQCCNSPHAENNQAFYQAVLRDVPARAQSTPQPGQVSEDSGNMANSYFLPELVLSSNLSIDSPSYLNNSSKERLSPQVFCNDFGSSVKRTSHTLKRDSCPSPESNNIKPSMVMPRSHVKKQATNYPKRERTFSSLYPFDKCYDAIEDIRFGNSKSDSMRFSPNTSPTHPIFRLSPLKMNCDKSNITDDFKAAATLAATYPKSPIQADKGNVPVNENLKVSVYDHSKILRPNSGPKLNKKNGRNLAYDVIPPSLGRLDALSVRATNVKFVHNSTGPVLSISSPYKGTTTENKFGLNNQGENLLTSVKINQGNENKRKIIEKTSRNTLYSIPKILSVSDPLTKGLFNRNVKSSLISSLPKEMMTIEEMSEDVNDTISTSELPEVREDPIGEDSSSESQSKFLESFCKDEERKEFHENFTKEGNRKKLLESFCEDEERKEFLENITKEGNRKKLNESFSKEEDKKEIADFGWYWGPITRFEAESRLANLPDGTFLVRDSFNDRYLLSLSFRSQKKTYHTRIEQNNGHYSLCRNSDADGSYKTVQSLIDSCISQSTNGISFLSTPTKKGVPSFSLKLITPLSRFIEVRSLQYLCRFALRKSPEIQSRVPQLNNSSRL